MEYTKPIDSVTEQWFREFWHHQAIDRHDLFTESGTSLSVVYPGRPNDGRGADFRDAVVVHGEKLLKGDVEIHLRSGDWRNHGHHRDHHYNSVILHVVLTHNSRTGTMLENGNEIPVLSLAERLASRDGIAEKYTAPGINGVPCTGVLSGSPGNLPDLLDGFGEQRFKEKARDIGQDILRNSEGETLYRRVMEAFGYSANKPGFRKLAERLPLSFLESGRTLLPSGGYRDRLQALLLGSAGFLAPDFHEKLVVAGVPEWRNSSLESVWSSAGCKVAMKPEDWQLFRIRPANSPLRRLLAMGNLLACCREKGFLAGMLEMVEACADSGDFRRLTKMLEDGAGRHPLADKGQNGEGTAVALIGKSRAAAVTVNVLLPFLYSLRQQERSGKEEVLGIYRRYPRLSENSLEKHMYMQLGLNKKLVKTAVRQQGLIHLHKTFCIAGRCGECDLGKFQSG